MSFHIIKTETREQAGLIFINRPEAMNALNGQVMAEIADALQAFDSDPGIGAMVITGDERAFAAGADIKEMAEATPIEMATVDRLSHLDRIAKINKPVIAAVSGWCLGGGNELAMSCDLIVASESAMFGQPEINLGIMPGAGGTQRLTHAVGKALAMEVILNDRRLTAQEALQHGLVNRVVPVELYLEDAVNLANELAARAPIAVRMAKEAVNQAYETSLTDGLADERRIFYLLFSTQDQKEGMQAFIEKRKAEWKGE